MTTYFEPSGQGRLLDLGFSGHYRVSCVCLKEKEKLVLREKAQIKFILSRNGSKIPDISANFFEKEKVSEEVNKANFFCLYRSLF